MRNLRLVNFRSFGDTTPIFLRPITLLVGANSTGKSSYLRFFPLMRQTAETSSRSPFLWFGRLVDLGDFSKAASHGHDSISFEFDIDVDRPAVRRRPVGTDQRLPLRISITLKASASQTYVSSVTLRCFDDVCKISLSSTEEVTTFVVNNVDILAVAKDTQPQVTAAPFIPNIFFPSPEPDPTAPPKSIYATLTAHLRSLAHNRTKDETLLSYATYQLRYGPTAEVLSAVKALKLRHLPNPRLDDSDFTFIRSLVFAKDIGYLVRATQRALTSFASGIAYLGPFRKDPERFYRHQELTVGQMEPHGENLAVFLRSLNKSSMDDLSNFVKDYLGFGVTVENDGSHIAVLMQERERGFNLIDMGYGLSQVLPVLAQCWSTVRGSRTSDREGRTTVLAIEQPELHLHPHHQAKLADMFANVMRDVRKSESVPAFRRMRSPFDETPHDFPLRILVETHSEALVNRIGELVEAKTLDPEDVGVLLFQKSESGTTTIQQATYAEDGSLKNWPIGFFAP
jgi:hypothetical protein